LGASFIWGGYTHALDALRRGTRPGGTIVIGEPFWRVPPSREHLEAAGLEETSYRTHVGNIEVGVERHLRFLTAVVSSEDDWDRYEGLQWYAAERYAEENRAEPDARQLLEGKHGDIYLRWGRSELGWAVYLFLKPRRERGAA